MRKLISNEQKKINGGGLHYHWYCNLNGYPSIGYHRQDECIIRKNVHADKYDHWDYMELWYCTGECEVI